MNRIGYIGSKYKLKDWIFDEIQKRTDDTYMKFADLFAGSCIMTHEALERKYECFSNDLEPYSYIIANGLKCNFTSVVKSIVDKINNSTGSSRTRIRQRQDVCSSRKKTQCELITYEMRSKL